ncbi:hypothetical protein K9N50_05420 [bacterium]|nr:hypothetical protein [bacterium]
MAALFVAILLFLLLFTVSFAQVQVELEPRKITVGDPVELTLSMPIPSGASVILPDPESFAPTEIIKLDTLRFGKDNISVRYTISAFESGKIELKELPVIFSYENKNDTLKVNAGSIVVESVLDPADSSMEIKDIHPPVKLFWLFRDVLPYLIVIISIIIIVIAAWLIRRRIKIKRGEIVPVGPPPPPPHVTALRRLEDLRIKKLWQNGFLKEYYSELTEIVKEYIGGRYSINAPEMTTYELLEVKNKWAANDDGFRQVKRILTSGDLVKFARYKADPSENETNLNYAFSYVDLTKSAIEDNMIKNKEKQESGNDS